MQQQQRQIKKINREKRGASTPIDDATGNNWIIVETQNKTNGLEASSRMLSALGNQKKNMEKGHPVKEETIPVIEAHKQTERQKKEENMRIPRSSSQEAPKADVPSTMEPFPVFTVFDVRHPPFVGAETQPWNWSLFPIRDP